MKYNYNSERSGCIDVNGNEIINAISYDNQTSMVTVTSNKTAYCYMYFDLDGISPQAFEFYLGGQSNPDYTNNNVINVYINYSDVDISHYCVTEENSSSNCEWKESSNSPLNTSYTLSSGDGLKTVYAYTKDLAGNISEQVIDTINLDTEKPTNNTISINNNATYTQSTSVTLTLSSSGATEMCISNTNSCTAWEPYATSKNWTLTSTDENKTVYVWYKDIAGNISDSVSDSITLDSSAPSGNSVSINNNEAYTTSTSVTLTLKSTGATKMCISNSSSCTSYVDYATSYSWTLSSGLGSKTVYVYFKDDAGNVSSAVTDTINLYSVVSTVPSQSGALTYSGSAQSPSWSNYDSNKLTLGGTTSKTDAGTYSTTFTPKTNYIWSDGTTTAKSVNWTIGKASGSLSLSSSSVTINVGASTNVTTTRSGDGVVSANSNNTGVATVSVSGTTITITGKASGSATITVSVAEGTNHTAPSNKTISVTVKIPTTGETILNTLKPSGLNTTMEGGLYRFQGTSANNYICFGTSDKSTCTGNTDAYMYRIIGINSSGQLKLIKKEALNTAYVWYSSHRTDITWPNSDLFTGLNGSYFLSNTTYVPSAWSSKIATTSWKYGDTSSEGNYNGSTIYTIENGWSTTTSAKIGLIFIHDYYYSYASGGNPGSYSNAKTSWLHLSKNDSGASSTTEWFMSRYGYDGKYAKAWCVTSSGYVSSEYLSSDYAVRPVFFLISDVQYVSGSGTLADPIIIK